MKLTKYAVFLVTAIVLLYNSIYFESLSEHQAAQKSASFDAATYASNFWELLQHELKNAVPAAILLELLQTDMRMAIAQYGKTLGVSNSHTFLLHGSGTISAISDDALLVSIQPPPTQAEVAIATGFIFGNDIRDASGLAAVSDFPSTMEFNTISSEINRIVVNTVLPPVLAETRVGRRIRFYAATTVNEEVLLPTPLRIVPIKLELID